MTQNRKLLTVKRYQQYDSECALASTASIAHYYDDSITYSDVRKLVPENRRRLGLYTPQQCDLLNKLGFKNVTVVSCDLNIFDFSWNRLTTAGIQRRLAKSIKWHERQDQNYATIAELYIRWLDRKDCNNEIIIDTDLPKYIKRHLDYNRPVVSSYFYTSLWKNAKGSMYREQDIQGEITEHAVVLRGYDDSGVFVVDSNRTRKGFYKLTWNDFLINCCKDLILIRTDI